eukprot:gene11960-13197_t
MRLQLGAVDRSDLVAHRSYCPRYVKQRETPCFELRATSREIYSLSFSGSYYFAMKCHGVDSIAVAFLVFLHVQCIECFKNAATQEQNNKQYLSVGNDSRDVKRYHRHAKLTFRSLANKQEKNHNTKNRHATRLLSHEAKRHSRLTDDKADRILSIEDNIKFEDKVIQLMKADDSDVLKDINEDEDPFLFIHTKSRYFKLRNTTEAFKRSNLHFLAFNSTMPDVSPGYPRMPFEPVVPQKTATTAQPSLSASIPTQNASQPSQNASPTDAAKPAALREMKAARVCKAGPPLASNKRLPNCLIIGDSIALSYSYSVAAALQGKCVVQIAPFSSMGVGLDSSHGLQCLPLLLSTSNLTPTRYDAIVFNFGMHDIDFTSKFPEEFNDVKKYKRNLGRLKKMFLKTGAGIAFVLTTPVPFDKEKNDLVQEYNKAAERVMARDPSIDTVNLYKFVVDKCGEPPFEDCFMLKKAHDVHYGVSGSILLGKQVAAKFIKILKSRDLLVKKGFGLPENVNLSMPLFHLKKGSSKCSTNATIPTRCPSTMTCVPNQISRTGFGCCPLPNGVDCGDNWHCCPENMTCDKDLRSFYSATDADLASVNSKVSKFQCAQIENDNKILRFKFQKGSPREHYDWGRMQTHRTPVGLIGIARLSADPKMQAKDMEKITHRFANMKCQYEAMLYDSRCIILCTSKPEIALQSNFIFIEDGACNDGGDDTLQSFIREFISSLFVVLESKRVEKTNEKFEKMDLPTAPIEQEQVITESDTRTVKRKCLGRNRKLLGDLCLLSGLYQDALYHYNHASENLRMVSDYLWMGAALEGLCATSIIMTKVEVPFLSSRLVLPQSSNTNVAKGDLNLDEDRAKIYIPLTDEDIIAKYSEVLGCYRKFKTAHIEMEAHLKFIKILLSMNKVMDVCQVIQGLLTLPLHYNDSEKVDLCKVIATIFDQMNLKRKAAFFRRRAAMHCTNQNNATLKVLRYANAALLKTTGGYMLNLSTHDRTTNSNRRGWSSLQLQILLDIFNVSTRLGDTINCIRLLCYILEVHRGDLNEKKATDLINRLEDSSIAVEEQWASKDNRRNSSDGFEAVEMILPLPIVRNFKPRSLAHHLQPKKLAKQSDHGGPFIYSSLYFKSRMKKEEEIIWVCGDVSEVGMTVDNPLPAEIKVKKMILLTEGIEFEAFPATLALPAESGSFPFMLLGTPMHSGTLIIKGYKVDVFGIENSVILPKPITVKVTPSLPMIRLSSSLAVASQLTHANPEDEHYQTLFTSISLYRGHSTTATMTLENSGKIPVKNISVKLQKTTEKAILIDEEVFDSFLPLEPGTSASFDIVVMPSVAWTISPTAEKIKATLTFSYSCEEDAAEGFGREISMVVDIKVMPSLSLSNFDVYEIARHPSCCCLCFDVENHTSIAMNIETNVKETQDIKLRDGCPCKAKTVVPNKAKKRIGVHFPRCLLFLPNTRMNRKIELVYTKAIKEAVDINWILVSFHNSESEYSGVTYLSDFKCDLDMVEILKPRHLDMRITINQVELKENGDLKTKLCEMNHVNVQLTNAHEFDLYDLNLSINAHQDEAIKRIESTNFVIHCGSLKKLTRKLSPNEALDHSCGLLFLYTGEYIIDVSCTISKTPARRSVKRERARAIINDDVNQSSYDMPDSANDDLQLSVDGSVSPLRRSKDETHTGKILHKPSGNKWERSFVVRVS